MGILVIEDIKVVREQLHENAQVFPESHTYYSLISGLDVFETERYDNLGKSPQLVMNVVLY
jgi:hypothetical protein